MKLFYNWGEKILYRYRFIRIHQILHQPLIFLEKTVRYHRSEDLATTGPHYTQTPKSSSNNPTESDNLISMSWTKGTILKRSTRWSKTLNSCSLIPIRTRKRKRISGYWRRKMVNVVWPWLISSEKQGWNYIIHLEKEVRKSLEARKFRFQGKENKIKVILYNLSRLMKLFSVLIIAEGFYRAVFPATEIFWQEITLAHSNSIHDQFYFRW